jgi:two-component system sensor histidine kinase CpxA
MRSLFLKIFLWFWLAMVLATLTLSISSSISQSRSSRDREERMDRTMTPLVADNFAEVFSREGVNGFVAFLERGKEVFPWVVYLFDESGVELTSRPFPAPVKQGFERAIASKQTEIVRYGSSRVVGQWVRAGNGRPYVVVLDLSRPPGPAPFLRATSQVQIARFLIILLIVGLICLWITRHITKPIFELREAANRLAGGDLETRVGPTSVGRVDELGDLSRDFNHMAEQLQSLITSRQHLIGDISHELRSPLARLSVALGIALRSASPETKPALNRIERETLRLNELISEILRLARLESGAEILGRDEVNLENLVREIADDANFEAGSRNRTVRVVATSPAVVRGNWELLRSAVENVVRNAIHHTPEGTTVEITLQPGSSRNEAILRVRDRGPGVPPSALRSIFEPFYRVENARERASGGSGLGLSISDRAIRSHGGNVQACNAEDGGLIIEISLPVQPRLPSSN